MSYWSDYRASKRAKGQCAFCTNPARGSLCVDCKKRQRAARAGRRQVDHHCSRCGADDHNVRRCQQGQGTIAGP